MPKPIGEAGWYDRRGSFHAGEPPIRWRDDNDEWQGRRVVIDFGEPGKPDYKTLWPSDWDFDDWDSFLEQADDWYDSEYGEATQ